MREIVWTRPAERDLKAIFDFLVDKLVWEDDKALEHIDAIFDKVETLEGNYKIIYSFDPKHFYINLVFDTRQNPNKLRDRFEE